MAHSVDELPVDVKSDRRVPEPSRASRGALTGIAAALLVTALGAIGWHEGVFSPSSSTTPATGSSTPPIAVRAATPTAPPPRPATVVAPVDLGFANPAARCGDAEQMVAAGRTASSLVVICKEPNGRLLYRGVRLSLGVGVQLDDARAEGSTYVARSETATYVLSPKDLSIATGAAPANREVLLEYRVAKPVLPPVADKPAPPVLPAPLAIPSVGPKVPPSAVALTPLPSPVAPKPLTSPVAPNLPQQPKSAVALPFSQTGTGYGELTFTAESPWQLRYSMTCPAGTAVSGFISAGSPVGSVYYVSLRGGVTSPDTASGMSLPKPATGLTTVAISPSDVRCNWTISAG